MNLKIQAALLIFIYEIDILEKAKNSPDTRKALHFCKAFCSFEWSQLGLNQRPPDYESGATNQLSYRTVSPIFVIASASKGNCDCKYSDYFIYFKIKL